ncbi:MAG: hypothetical protein ACUVT2_05315 [Thiobacillaceae bacterium]
MKRLLPCLILASTTAIAGAAQPDASPLEGVDNRIPIMVTSQERAEVLAEMRTYLQGLYSIFNALARKDMRAVAVGARPVGKVLHHMPQGMRERLPLAYVEMGLGLHEVFDVIARDAETKADPFLTLSQLSEAMAYCSGCHDTYRLQVVRAQGLK